MKHFHLGSFQIKQFMSSCIRRKLWLHLLLTQAKTKTLRQKLKMQHPLDSKLGAKTYTLSLDANFATFHVDGLIWFFKNTYSRLQELHTDGQGVDENAGPTVVQKGTHLELIAYLCTVVSGKKYSLHLPKLMPYGRQCLRISINWIKQHSFGCWRETGGPICTS